ncbi:MAG: methionyl-tRNA formyltransferase [Planctomycetaceae bacterium]|nr:methionyl-tRNA formyltransferase [Planctomycetaceae bacterium]
MRIIVMGTGEFAVPSLKRLIERGHEILAVVTMPLRSNRGQDPPLTPMRAAAIKYDLPIHDPENINTQESADLLYLLAADVFFVCDYGRILSPMILKTARMGGLNLHGSLLPKYRGAAPIHRAILNGDTFTGISIIHMIPAVDAGPIVAQSPKISIEPNENAISVEHRLAEIGAWYVIQTLREMKTGRLRAYPQRVEEITKAPKLRKEEGILDWNADASVIHNHVRALVAWPKSSTFWKRKDSDDPVRLILGETSLLTDNPLIGPPVPPGTVVKAAGNQLIVVAGKHWVRILKIQYPGKAMVDAASFINGYRIQVGDRFIQVSDS